MWQNRRIVRWMQTQWCNYGCPYCPQDHARKQEFRGSPGHWADNAHPGRWLGAFDAHFSQYSTMFLITGGEPMLDRKHMQPLLAGLTERPYVYSVRIDTNGTWNPEDWPSSSTKVELMVSFHPSQTSWERFMLQLHRLIDRGWRIPMVTVVALPGEFELLPRYRVQLRKLNVQLNVNSLYGCYDQYSAEEKELLHLYIPAPDFPQRTGASPKRKLCLFPAIAYEMYPDGKLHVACHPDAHGDVFGTVPELPETYTSCPHTSCTCTDKYTFLKELELNKDATPLSSYSERLRELPMVE